MNNAVGSDDCRVLSDLSPEEREIIAKMISDRFDEMLAAWNEGYCGYGRESRTTLLKLHDNPRPRESAWGSFKRGIAKYIERLCESYDRPTRGAE